MRKNILINCKNKLNNQNGASLLVALLFFVMCATVGSIILAAATASAGRMKSYTESDRQYYLTSSAGKTLGEMISGKNPQITITKTIVFSEADKKTTETMEISGTGQDGNERYFLHSSVSSKITFLQTELDKVFSEYNTNLAFDADSFDPSPIANFNMVIDGNDNMSANIKLYINEYLDLKAEIKPLSGTNLATTTVIFPAIKKIDSGISGTSTDETGKRTTTTTKTYSLGWEKPVFQDGGTNV